MPIRHAGDDDSDNLCLACPDCNYEKGPNVAAIDPETNEAAKLYHLRQQQWSDHFQLNPDATIEGLTPEGRTTVAVLRLNTAARVKQRTADTAVGDYPCTPPPP